MRDEELISRKAEHLSTVRRHIQNNALLKRVLFFLFLFFFHFTYSRWTSSLPSCLWSQRIFPSLPGSRLTIFLSRCKFSTLPTRQPMVEFYWKTIYILYARSIRYAIDFSNSDLKKRHRKFRRAIQKKLSSSFATYGHLCLIKRAADNLINF